MTQAVKHHRHVDGVGDGAKIGLDLRILEREIGFKDGEDAGSAEALVVRACATASAVAVAATPATTGTRPAAASIVVRTTAVRCSLSR
jgi:hypothetical protein